MVTNVVLLLGQRRICFLSSLTQLQTIQWDPVIGDSSAWTKSKHTWHERHAGRDCQTSDKISVAWYNLKIHIFQEHSHEKWRHMLTLE